MSNAHYEPRAFCTCGWSASAWRGKVFFVDEAVCPQCGNDKKSFEVKAARWVSNSIWYRPSTWGTGYWKVRDE